MAKLISHLSVKIEILDDRDTPTEIEPCTLGYLLLAIVLYGMAMAAVARNGHCVKPAG